MGVLVNVIHNPDNIKRREVLLRELESQGIDNYELWGSIHDSKSVQAGINKAHKQIVQWAKEERLKEVIIFEDDIKFLGQGAFEYYLRHKPKDYDLYLGGIYLGKIVNDIVEKFTALHCYMVHERFYDTFLNTDSNNHLDGELAGLGKYYVCDPFIAIQHNGWSSNSKRYENFDSLFTHRNLFNDKIKV